MTVLPLRCAALAPPWGAPMLVECGDEAAQEADDALAGLPEEGR
ncbi:hypothetical protein [Streptomyces sp. NPDC007205]